MQCCKWWGEGGILFPGRVGALSQQIATSIIIHLTRVSRHRLPSIWTPPVPCSSNTDRVSPDFWQFRTRYGVLVVAIFTHMLFVPPFLLLLSLASRASRGSRGRCQSTDDATLRNSGSGSKLSGKKKSEAVKRNPKPQIYRHHPSALLQHTNQTDIHVYIYIYMYPCSPPKSNPMLR